MGRSQYVIQMDAPRVHADDKSGLTYTSNNLNVYVSESFTYTAASRMESYPGIEAATGVDDGVGRNNRPR